MGDERVRACLTGRVGDFEADVKSHDPDRVVFGVVDDAYLSAHPTGAAADRERAAAAAARGRLRVARGRRGARAGREATVASRAGAAGVADGARAAERLVDVGRP